MLNLRSKLRRNLLAYFSTNPHARHYVRELARVLEEGYLYGSFAKQTQIDPVSDIDILLIGKPNAEELEAAMSRLEKQFRREINYTLLSPQEFKQRRKRRDPF